MNPSKPSSAASSSAAESVQRTLARPGVDRALGWVEGNLEHFVADLMALSEIPAPTFAEARRAEHVATHLRQLGLEQVHTDAAGNVLGCLGGARPGRGVALVAHLDTVFLAATNVGVTRQDGRLYGPGIGDNGAGVEGMLLMLEALREAAIVPERPLWIVASTGEEGLGDLCGVRAAMDTLAEQVDAVVAIEGALLGRITHEAVGSLRWQVRFKGTGGHSWHDFGRASAINAAAMAIASIARLQVPASPRTTFNVGRIEGGTGVNVIAAEASFLLDMRSTDRAALANLVQQAEKVIRHAAREEGVSVAIETVGDRPAGSIARTSPLVQTAAAVLRHFGIEPRYEPASTDANIPLSRGIPAITVGITHGGGIHTEAEWLDLAPCMQGVQQLLLLTLTLSA